MKAKRIKEMEGWKGRAYLYELDEPLDGHNYVIVSAAVVPYSGPETYIFPADGPDAEDASDFGELDGSYRGGLSHEKALARAGYSV